MQDPERAAGLFEEARDALRGSRGSGGRTARATRALRIKDHRGGAYARAASKPRQARAEVGRRLRRRIGLTPQHACACESGRLAPDRSGLLSGSMAAGGGGRRLSTAAWLRQRLRRPLRPALFGRLNCWYARGPGTALPASIGRLRLAQHARLRAVSFVARPQGYRRAHGSGWSRQPAGPSASWLQVLSLCFVTSLSPRCRSGGFHQWRRSRARQRRPQRGCRRLLS